VVDEGLGDLEHHLLGRRVEGVAAVAGAHAGDAGDEHACLPGAGRARVREVSPAVGRERGVKRHPQEARLATERDPRVEIQGHRGRRDVGGVLEAVDHPALVREVPARVVARALEHGGDLVAAGVHRVGAHGADGACRGGRKGYAGAVDRPRVEAPRPPRIGCDHVGCDHVGCDHVGCDHVGCDHVGCDHVGCDHVGSVSRDDHVAKPRIHDAEVDAVARVHHVAHQILRARIEEGRGRPRGAGRHPDQGDEGE
jgi:hypothetical protein